MVVLPRLCVVMAGVLVIGLSFDGSFAADVPAPPAAVDTSDFDQFVARFKGQDDQLRKSADDFLEIVDAELAAKRIDPNFANALRNDARSGAEGLPDTRAIMQVSGNMKP